MMSRRDYLILANAIRNAREVESAKPELSHVIDYVEHEIEDALALDNPHFDKTRFRIASGTKL